MRSSYPFHPFQHGADCCGDGLALVFLADGELVERLALFLVELLPTIVDMPATVARQCNGIGHVPAGAMLPELVERGVSEVSKRS